jgi:hypothetical protein
MHDTTGNLPSLPGIFPDYPAPIVRNALDGVRELAMVRWGMPSSNQAIYQSASKRADKLRAKGKEVDFTELLRREPDGGTNTRPKRKCSCFDVGRPLSGSTMRPRRHGRRNRPLKQRLQ